MKKLTKLLAVIATVIIGLGMYLVGWVVLPTICEIPEGSKIKFRIINCFFGMFQKNPEIYILISFLFASMISISLYNMIMYIAKIKYSKIYSSKGIKKEYTEFIQDASELYIIGGDLDFLLYQEEQKERIQRLGNRCKILYGYSKNEERFELKQIYIELLAQKVGIRKFYKTENEIKNLRGQIKICKDGTKHCLLVNRLVRNNKKNEYEMLNIENQFLIECIIKNFNEIYLNSKNPLIKFILFDLGGVYFDGDFDNDFLKVINKYLHVQLKGNRKQKLFIDERVNLGEITIIEWIEENINRELNESEKKKVEETWKNIWKPNIEIQKLIGMLKNEGYEVGVLSNLDSINGDEYNERGDLSLFPLKYRFLSYERKMLKPSKDFFELVINETGFTPYEILFIDDHEDNIKVAQSINMHTILFSLKKNTDISKLKDALGKFNVKF